MKVGIYIRVSTKEQAEGGYSIGEQTERLKAYCLARGWTIYQIYTDPGMSGSNIDRPAMRQMEKDIRDGKINLVLVYKLDRLSRSQKDTLYLIEDVFLKNNVDFVSMNENFDTSTPFGRAMIGILSVFAQLEREQIVERMYMGRHARAKDGYYHGGGNEPIGYDYVDGELIVNEYEAMQVRKIHEMFLADVPVNAIQSHMKKHYTTKHGAWTSNSTLRKVLTQKLYIGIIEWEDEEYKGRHEPILDEDTFYRSLKKHEERKWIKGQPDHIARPFRAKHLLTGLVYCGNCTARYSAKGNYSGVGENRKYRPYYTCYSRSKTAKKMIIDPTCKNKTYAVVDLDRIISDEIKKLHFDPSLIDTIINEEVYDEREQIEKDNETIMSRIATIDVQMTKLLDLYQLDNIPFDVLSKRMDDLTNEKESLYDEIKESEKHVPELTRLEAIELVERAAYVLDHGELADRRKLVHSLIDTIIIVDDEDIEIHWSFV